jgi:hypothetical protein
MCHAKRGNMLQLSGLGLEIVPTRRMRKVGDQVSESRVLKRSPCRRYPGSLWGVESGELRMVESWGGISNWVFVVYWPCHLYSLVLGFMIRASFWMKDSSIEVIIPCEFGPDVLLCLNAGLVCIRDEYRILNLYFLGLTRKIFLSYALHWWE